MIASLSGQLKHIFQESIVLEISGVGFEIRVSRLTLEALPPVDSQVFIHTYLHVREDELRLFGFVTAEEKRLFLLLIGLPKVGVKIALDILSTYSVDDFRKIVLSEDLARFTQVPGVGKKTAERLLFELKHRLEKLPEPVHALKGREIEGDRFNQAVQGMIYLGCRYSIAVQAIQRAIEILGKESPVEDLIKEGLKHR